MKSEKVNLLKPSEAGSCLCPLRAQFDLRGENREVSICTLLDDQVHPPLLQQLELKSLPAGALTRLELEAISRKVIPNI